MPPALVAAPPRQGNLHGFREFDPGMNQSGPAEDFLSIASQRPFVCSVLQTMKVLLAREEFRAIANCDEWHSQVSYSRPLFIRCRCFLIRKNRQRMKRDSESIEGVALMLVWVPGEARAKAKRVARFKVSDVTIKGCDEEPPMPTNAYTPPSDRCHHSHRCANSGRSCQSRARNK